MRCPSCAGEVPGSARFCMVCGAAVREPEPSVAPTRQGRPASWRGSTSTDPGQGRFVAGHVLAGRYRITGLLGRGGMGEVYRADDLKLGQTVALKFLPADLPSDPGRLARFHGEVRLARQVSHPNVCRVYDIGEADGQPFLTMEYVDGEDLASLLRRIRRLPPDKGVEVARQICAGLAAAHERGVIHRDLKPANIMIDGRGRARITDFGLAAADDDAARADRHAGTPLYMAPEQLEGREATVRSDLYALGLVLYELFTGQMPFPTDSRAAWERARRESTPLTPSSVTPGLDPAIERVVLRCLQSEPADRPASALAVSAALPGGDPLAAALAAGETPSPEMVAAAGAEGALSPRVAWTCLLSTLVLIALAVAGSDRSYLVNVAGLDLPAPVLAQKAREAVAALGHDAPAADTAYGFVELSPWLDWLMKNDQSSDRWSSLAGGRPPGVVFWFRQSPRHMVSKETFAIVGPEEPPPLVPGMATVILDPQGRVVRFQAVPDEVAPPRVSPAVETPWSRLFDLAGLDAGQFKAATPSLTPPVFCDERAAWEGTLAGRADLPLRIEACSLNGRPVHFAIHGPWDLNGTAASDGADTALTAEQIRIVLLVIALAGAMFMARHNVAAGRGDRRGAFTVALYFTVVHILVWAMWVSHVPALDQEWNIFTVDTGWTLFNAVSIWLFYLALEPWVRRLWPTTIISWSRLMTGRLRDARVGRDLLMGLLVGAATGASLLVESWIVFLLGWPPARPAWILAGDLSSLFSVSAIVDGHVHAILYGMQGLSILLLLRILVRRVWLASLLLVVPMAGQLGLVDATYPSVTVPMTVVLMLLTFWVMVRFGLLSAIAAIFMSVAFGSVPVTSHLGAWYAGPTWWLLAAMTGLALFAFHISLGGRPALRLIPEEARIT